MNDIFEPRKVQKLPTTKVLENDLKQFVQELKEQHADISLETICSICIDIMQKVQKFKTLNGPEKKRVVVYVIYKLIEHVDDKMYVKYEIIIEKCITSMIDIVIDLDKHKVKIKEGIGILTSVLKSCGFCE